MFLETLLFELKYRFKRPATYLYFFILLALSALAATTEIIQIGGAFGNVMHNSAFMLTTWYMVFAIFGMLMVSGIMGVPIIRDFQHNTASMFFTTPYKSWQYLFGRFTGSFIIVLFVFLGVVFGFLFGQLSPWAEADKLMAFNLGNYFKPYFFFLVPLLFILSALFFSVGTMSRKIMVVYTQGIFLLVLYMVVTSFSGSIENERLASIFEPFGFGAFSTETQYWTVAEKNTLMPPVSGLILLNRLVWMGIAVVLLLVTWLSFRFNLVRSSIRRKKLKNEVQSAISPKDVSIPVVNQNLGLMTQLGQMLNLTKLYTKSVIKSWPFVAIVLMGFGLLLVNSMNWNQMFGTKTLPNTASMIGLVSTFNFFFYIIIVYFTGELVWRERDVKINLIYDATPLKNWVTVISKLLSMTFIIIIILFILMLSGMLVQAMNGYFNFEPHIYLKKLFVDDLLGWILYIILGIFIHTLVNNKFLGHALIIVFIVALLVLPNLGIEHKMFYFGRNGLGPYSDMNGFGHYFQPFNWFSLYWYGFAFLLFAGIVLFATRGAESIMKMRWRVAKLRYGRPLMIFTIASALMFLCSGCFIYYNTNVKNEFENSDDLEVQQAAYEKDLKQYEYIPAPKITATTLEVDIFPDQRSFNAKGVYTLTNKTDDIISDVHIQENDHEDLTTNALSFEGGASIKENFEDYQYTIYKLNKPLLPGQSVELNFDLSYVTSGFKEAGSNTSIVYNGTFFNNMYFPMIGYLESVELGDDDKREDNGLAKKDRMLDQDDPRGLAQCLFGNDADFIDFEITMSTSANQIAIAPGYLQKEWEENGRKYFHYKMDKPMANFYSMVSARYDVLEDSWTSPTGEDIKLQVFYHPTHDYNIETMMKAMKESLSYYTENFSPFQFRQMRIMEFPNYSTFAQSFANTVPFSEGIGFLQDAKKNDVDATYYVTSHEVAHQWWGHQVMEAGVKGSAMLSETLSQYSALMVMRKTNSDAQMQKFLEYELDKYLMGRGSERKKENPIYLTEHQQYIHYNKGSLLMYALQDFIGEEKVNEALRSYLSDWAYKEAPYPTTEDFLGYIKEVTPDSLAYLIDDFFYKITLYENKTEEASYKKLGKNDYEVTIKFNSKKYEADSLGNEISIPMDDWVDIGVYSMSKGEEVLAYRKKHLISKEENEITIKVNKIPYRAGIDPMNILIDRNPRDNVESVSEVQNEET